MKKQIFPFLIFSILFICVYLAYQTHDSLKERNLSSISSKELKKKLNKNDPQIKSIQTYSKVLQLSQQIFQESWRIIWERKNLTVVSPFKAINNRLKLHLASSEDTFANVVGACPQYESHLTVLNWSAKKEPLSFLLEYKDCSDNSLIEIARWEIRNNYWSASYRAQGLKDGFGRKMDFLNKVATCDFFLDDQERLQRLSCKNLGQDKNLTEHIEYTNFIFEKNRNNILIIQGDKFDNLRRQCDEKAPCLSINVPLSGKIAYTESFLSESEKSQLLINNTNNINKTTDPKNTSDNVTSLDSQSRVPQKKEQVLLR